MELRRLMELDDAVDYIEDEIKNNKPVLETKSEGN